MKIKSIIRPLAPALAMLGMILVMLLILLMIEGSTPPISEAQGAEKISARLLSMTRNGGQTEFFVILTQQADLGGAAKLTGKAKTRYVYETLWKTAQISQAPLKAWLDKQKIPYRTFYIANTLLVAGDRNLVLTLAARPDVARLEANSRFRSLSQPWSEPEKGTDAANIAAGVEDNIAYVKADAVWDLGFTGQNIVIGGQDTGYAWTHPALKNQYRGWNGAGASHDYHWHDSIHNTDFGSDCGADAAQPCDDNGHGTHTMGTALGDDGAGNQIGMAPGAQWIGCRNMDEGWGTPASYLECFEFFLAPYPIGGTPAEGVPELAPDVTVNSWSCPPYEGCTWNTLQLAVEAQRAAGIMTVVAAGNSGPNCSTIANPPGLYDAAYSVGALVKNSDSLASFSSRGPVMIDGSQRRKPDLTAPGTSIRSSTRGDGYATLNGTSMATPHVAGAVALLWSAVPGLANNIAATETYLNDQAVHLTGAACNSDDWPNNLYGYGRLDILAAVQAAREDAMKPPTASFTYTLPALVNYPIQFTNLTNGYYPITSTWDFGDGFRQTVQTVPGLNYDPLLHIYTTTGSYTVILTATNILGQAVFADRLTVTSGYIHYFPILQD